MIYRSLLVILIGYETIVELIIKYYHHCSISWKVTMISTCLGNWQEAKTALSHIEGELRKQQCHRWVGLPIQLYLCNQDLQLLALLAQWDPNAPDPLFLLKWVFLPHQPTKTLATRVEMFAALIKRGRERIVEIAGIEPETVVIPIVKEYLDWCLQNRLEMQLALMGFTGWVDIHLPSHKLIIFYNNIRIEPKPLYQWQPVQGQTVFTDGSGKTGKAVVTWEKNGQWQHMIDVVQGSPQIVELHAIIMAFKNWSNEPLNIVVDWQYAVGVVQWIKRAQIRYIQNEMLVLKFKELLFLVEWYLYPYCVIHVLSHTRHFHWGQRSSRSFNQFGHTTPSP